MNPFKFAHIRKSRRGYMICPDGILAGQLIHVEWNAKTGPTVMMNDWTRESNWQPDDFSKFWDLMNIWKSEGLHLDTKFHCCDRDGDRICIDSLTKTMHDIPMLKVV